MINSSNGSSSNADPPIKLKNFLFKNNDIKDDIM